MNKGYFTVEEFGKDFNGDMVYIVTVYDSNGEVTAKNDVSDYDIRVVVDALIKNGLVRN
jgi:hypothetical protein